MKKITFAIKTLGCKVNQYESQLIRENLEKAGYSESSPQSAAVVIINSCTVTAQADQKTRQLANRSRKENPSAKIIITGCYAESPEDMKTIKAMSTVDMVVPNSEKMKLIPVLDEIFGLPARRGEITKKISDFRSRTRAFVKIQDGCDQKCAFCKVSLVRSVLENRDEGQALDEIACLAKKGYKEIVITGICLGSWKGARGRKLADLLGEIEKLPGDFRVRLSSMEPNYIDEELIKTIAASSRICKHLHIPLQSGSDKILALMKRRYNAVQFTELIQKLRAYVKNIGITMDIIAGFPGETENDHKETIKLVEKLKPSRLHVFKYSDREGTLSCGMKDKVSADAAKKRVDDLIALGGKLQREFAEQFVGREVEVLVEGKIKDMCLEGFTSEYVRVKLMGFSGTEGHILHVTPETTDKDLPSLIVHGGK